MKLLKKSVPVWGVLLLVILTGAAIAAIVFTYQLSNTMTIISNYELEVWNEAETQVITSIAWGDFSGIGNFKDTTVVIKNIGNAETKPSWNATSMPTQFSISCQWSIDGTLWTNLPADVVSVSMPPLINSDTVMFKFTLTVEADIPGDYGFTLNINANDVP